MPATAVSSPSSVLSSTSRALLNGTLRKVSASSASKSGVDAGRAPRAKRSRPGRIHDYRRDNTRRAAPSRWRRDQSPRGARGPPERGHQEHECDRRGKTAEALDELPDLLPGQRSQQLGEHFPAEDEQQESAEGSDEDNGAQCNLNPANRLNQRAIANRRGVDAEDREVGCPRLAVHEGANPAVADQQAGHGQPKHPRQVLR